MGGGLQTMHYNNFRCGHQNCMRAGDGKQLYYKSWPYAAILGIYHESILASSGMAVRAAIVIDM